MVNLAKVVAAAMAVLAVAGSAEAIKCLKGIRIAHAIEKCDATVTQCYVCKL